MQQALIIFFIILLIIFVFVMFLNGMVSHLVDGVLKKENFVSEITGLETRDEVNKKNHLILHDEAGYDQLNFQVSNNIPLIQTIDYSNYINKYYMNDDINKSVDKDMEIHGNMNMPKPDFYYDGVWKPTYHKQGDYQKVTWADSDPVNGFRGKLMMDKLLEQNNVKPMPEKSVYEMCNLPNEHDRLCYKNSMNEQHKKDDVKCFSTLLDPMV